MARCYDWTMPSAETADYHMMYYPPGGGAAYPVSLMEVEQWDNGDGTVSFYLCLGEYPQFFNASMELVSLPYAVNVGGNCTVNGQCTPVEPDRYILTLQANGNGVVYGGGGYLQGETAHVIAEADSDSEFLFWTHNGLEVSDLASFNYTMPGQATTLVAHFQLSADPNNYGLKFLLEYEKIDGTPVREEVYQKGYTGDPVLVDGGATPFELSRENNEDVFTQFRGSAATLRFSSQITKFFFELFEGDERTYKVVHKENNVITWQGWMTPDLFEERYMPGPYQTVIKATDGIGSLKNTPLPDLFGTNYSGQIEELKVIVSALSVTDLQLPIMIAVNLFENRMTEAFDPLTQSEVNMEAFIEMDKGERTPMSCYEAVEKILKSWNACLWQEDNEWKIVRIPELFGDNISYRRFDANGFFMESGTFPLPKTFLGEGIKLNDANLQTERAYKKISVSQNFGDLIVKEDNFVANGSFSDWEPILNPNGSLFSWKLKDWIYNNLAPTFTAAGQMWGDVRRVEESTGLDSSNNYINIFNPLTAFNQLGRYLQAPPQFIKAEVGNVLNVKFKVRCNTRGSDKRLVEAYFMVMVLAGGKWIGTDGNGGYEWKDTETLLTWKVAEVMRWENIEIPEMELPQDGDAMIRIYPIVQIGSTSKVEYVADYDDVIIEIVKNPALLNKKIHYKSTHPSRYTTALDEVEIELGDTLTVMSQNSKIISGEFSEKWHRQGKSEARPLAYIIARDYVNQFQNTTYKLSGGNCSADLKLLANYKDTENEPDRKFIFSGGTYDCKRNRWRAEFLEINQNETLTEIRPVTEAADYQGGGGSGGSGSSTPTSGSEASLDLADGVIPQVYDGSLTESGLTVVYNSEGVFQHFQFNGRVKGQPAVNDNEFVTKSQLSEQGLVVPDGIVQYGGVEQDGNDIELDNLWVWRLASVLYNKPDSTLFPIPEAASGYTRIDLIVGNGSNGMDRVAGTEVELPDAALPPNVPAGTVGLLMVFVTDVGVVDFIEFALSSFVRFDVNNQDLNEVQRQNARTNIQALSKDTNDSRTGQLTQNGKVLLNVGTESNGGVSISFPDTLCTFPNNNTAGLFMRGRPANVLASYLVRLMSGENFDILRIRNRGDVRFDSFIGGSVWEGFSIYRNNNPIFKFANQSDMDIPGGCKFFARVTSAYRSSVAQELVRRDELGILYPQTIATDGQLDNLEINADAKLLIFTQADILTGIVLEANRKLLIFNNSGSDIEIIAESTASAAANRFATGVTIPNQGFQEVIKIGTRIRLI